MKKYMTGVFADLHFVAEWIPEREIYKCIPAYSRGNGTDMTFFKDKPGAKFFDTLPDALGNKVNHNKRLAGIREERQLTGYYNREY